MERGRQSRAGFTEHYLDLVRNSQHVRPRFARFVLWLVVAFTFWALAIEVRDIVTLSTDGQSPLEIALVLTLLPAFGLLLAWILVRTRRAE